MICFKNSGVSLENKISTNLESFFSPKIILPIFNKYISYTFGSTRYSVNLIKKVKLFVSFSAEYS